MLVRNTISPVMRLALTGGGRRTLAFPSSNFAAFPIRQSGGVTSTTTCNNLLMQAHALRPTRISAALLTTQSNGSPVQNAASSLRARTAAAAASKKLPPVTPLPPGLFVGSNHHLLGPLAYFSSNSPFGRGGGAGGGRMGMMGGVLGAGALLLGKGKYLLAALKITKLAPLASMVVSVGAYTMVFGFPYAVGMVGLIFVHETGHALVMHHYGVPFSPMVFLPFMGAVISMKDQPKDAWQNAMIAIGGPAMGTAGAMAVAVGAQMTDSQLLYALADFGYMINLFNMLPIGDMDGGRITAALSPYFGVAGLAGGAAMIYNGLILNPLFYLIMLAGGWTTFQRFYDPAAHRPPNFYKITPMQRVAVGTSYFGLIGTMLLAMSANQVKKKSPQEIKQSQELYFDEREF